mmetsp:Transcript_29412/g.76298  ORF Transcript_29412/g.76298 Transcript_29412/m.76298 type:complete len:301 (-) Transcript_29412:104-1006(-)
MEGWKNTAIFVPLCCADEGLQDGAAQVRQLPPGHDLADNWMHVLALLKTLLNRILEMSGAPLRFGSLFSFQLLKWMISFLISSCLLLTPSTILYSPGASMPRPKVSISASNSPSGTSISSSRSRVGWFTWSRSPPNLAARHHTCAAAAAPSCVAAAAARAALFPAPPAPSPGVASPASTSFTIPCSTFTLGTWWEAATLSGSHFWPVASSEPSTYADISVSITAPCSRGCVLMEGSATWCLSTTWCSGLASKRAFGMVGSRNSGSRASSASSSCSTPGVAPASAPCCALLTDPFAAAQGT